MSEFVKVNDSTSHPLRFVAKDGSRTLGQFFNSYDRLYHLGDYVSYTGRQEKVLCPATGNFTISRRDTPARHMCEVCFAILGAYGDQ